MIVGIDEVGRGAWAGPMVVGAVALTGNQIAGLADSKKLSAQKRYTLAGMIRKTTPHIGLGWVSAQTIDAIGLTAALKVAAKQALSDITIEYDEIIIDGTIKLIDDERVTTLKQADTLVPSVSAASIIAKVARDYYMHTISAEYPMYGFDKHVGYGTSYHRQAIEKHGVSDIHRMSFAPMCTLQEKSQQKPVGIGSIAETGAADYLQHKGYKIIDRNWRTKYCEIDIIAAKNDTVYFTEVKYRRQPNQGGGMAAITPKKLQQMKFSVAVWQKYHSDDTRDVQLAVVAMSGDPPRVEHFLKIA